MWSTFTLKDKFTVLTFGTKFKVACAESPFFAVP